jgi:3-oxoadipate enol-lactonase
MKQIQVDGLQLSFLDEGIGPALLLLHGFPLDHTMWHHQIHSLSRTYRVIAPDLRGMGQSSAAAGPFTLTRYALDCLALLDLLNIKQAAVCGFSLGGYIAMSLLSLVPERITALVLANTRPDADPPQGRQNRFKMAADLVEQGSAAASTAMLPKLFTAETAADQPQLIEDLRTRIIAMNADGLIQACLAMAYRTDSTALLGSFQGPALVIGGNQDPITTPEVTRKMADGIPKASYKLIANAAHLTPVEQPQAFTEVLETFLAAHL